MTASATSSVQAASLLQGVQDARLDEVLARLQAFTPEAITTCYLQYDAAVRLDAVLRPRRCAGAALGPVRLRPGQLDARRGTAGRRHQRVRHGRWQGHGPLAQAIAAQLAQVLRLPSWHSPPGAS
jgi:hypothetical protein